MMKIKYFINKYYFFYYLILKNKITIKNFYLVINISFTHGDGDWGLGIGDWGLGIGPNPQSPIPNPQSPF